MANHGQCNGAKVAIAAVRHATFHHWLNLRRHMHVGISSKHNDARIPEACCSYCATSLAFLAAGPGSLLGAGDTASAQAAGSEAVLEVYVATCVVKV